MPGLIRPPFGEPTGPSLDEHLLFASFVDGVRTGHSARHHIEESALLLDRLSPVALRLEEGALLVRTDLVSPGLHRDLPGLGFSLAVRDPPLATVVSLQTLGMPAATWDLWCVDGVEGQECLRRVIAAGETVPWT